MTIEEIIAFLLGNFTLTFFVIGLIVSAVSLARKPKPVTAPVVVEALFKWFLFFSIGSPTSIMASSMSSSTKWRRRSSAGPTARSRSSSVSRASVWG